MNTQLAATIYEFNDGSALLTLAEGQKRNGERMWSFPCRGMALQFAARRGIRIEVAP